MGRFPLTEFTESELGALVRSCSRLPSAAFTAATTSKWKKGVFSSDMGWPYVIAASLFDDDDPLRNSVMGCCLFDSRSIFSPVALSLSLSWSSMLRTSPRSTTGAISAGVRPLRPIPNPPAMRARRIQGERTVAKWNYERRVSKY